MLFTIGFFLGLAVGCWAMYKFLTAMDNGDPPTTW